MADAEARFTEWQSLLDQISRDDEFPMTAKERGLIFSLLASPPETLTHTHVGQLTHVETRWRAYLKERKA